MHIDQFVNITSRAWALPILSKLHLGIAGRQAPLMVATGASRTAFAQSVGHLISIGLLERNPGYGHPLRPEFRLTTTGVSAAAIANKIQSTVPPQDHKFLRRAWTLPVLASLRRPIRFNEIKQNLPSITDRALSQSLKAMEARSWVCRNVDETSRPPRPLYFPVNTGKALCKTTEDEIRLVA